MAKFVATEQEQSSTQEILEMAKESKEVKNQRMQIVITPSDHTALKKIVTMRRVTLNSYVESLIKKAIASDTNQALIKAYDDTYENLKILED